MNETDNPPPEQENQFHTYVTHRVPWFIHALWLGFWILAIWYVLTFQFPVIPTEFKSPP
jgi:hypothetical protein